MTHDSIESLTGYIEALSFATIARVPNPPVIFGTPSAELREKLNVHVDEFNLKKNHYRFKGQIKNWTFWTFTDRAAPEQTSIHLTGTLTSQRGLNPYLTTSQVQQIASDLSGVITKSGSLYKLSNERGELNNDEFVHLICVLNSWGLGAYLNLPPLHY